MTLLLEVDNDDDSVLFFRNFTLTLNFNLLPMPLACMCVCRGGRGERCGVTDPTKETLINYEVP